MIALADVICPRIMPLGENVHPIEWGKRLADRGGRPESSGRRRAFAQFTAAGGGLDH